MRSFLHEATKGAQPQSTTPARWCRGARGMLLWLALALGAAAPAWADNCGGEGQRACNLNERVPSCDVNLVESAGRCIHPDCGRESQRGCGPHERMHIDPVLLGPTPQPCDENLKPDYIQRRCVRPDCGRQGQRACDVLTRIPSCDLNLVEERGVCIHPPLCGAEGQPLCAIHVRGPARRCDVDLVDRGGVCARPGSGDYHGATAAVPPPPPPTQAVPAPSAGSSSTPPRNAPPPPPRSSTPPPPAPPPATSVSPATPIPAAGNYGGAAMEADTDRMGADFTGFAMAQPDPAACMAACNANAACRAWTFVKPGIKGPAAQCFLKNAVPPPTRNACCVSGAKPDARSSLSAPMR